MPARRDIITPHIGTNLGEVHSFDDGGFELPDPSCRFHNKPDSLPGLVSWFINDAPGLVGISEREVHNFKEEQRQQALGKVALV